MSRKAKKEIYKVTPKTHNKMSRVGDLTIPGKLKAGQVIVGFSDLLNQWLVYRITQSLKVISSSCTFKSQQDAQTYANQYTYVSGLWQFSPATPSRSQVSSEDFNDYLHDFS